MKRGAFLAAIAAAVAAPIASKIPSARATAPVVVAKKYATITLPKCGYLQRLHFRFVFAEQKEFRRRAAMVRNMTAKRLSAFGASE